MDSSGTPAPLQLKTKSGHLNEEPIRRAFPNRDYASAEIYRPASALSRINRQCKNTNISAMYLQCSRNYSVHTRELRTDLPKSHYPDKETTQKFLSYTQCTSLGGYVVLSVPPRTHRRTDSKYNAEQRVQCTRKTQETVERSKRYYTDRYAAHRRRSSTR